MEKSFHCGHCAAAHKVEGLVQGTRETELLVTCKSCGTPNEVSWPIQHGQYTVTLVSSGNGGEDILL